MHQADPFAMEPLVPGKAPRDTRVVVAMSGGVDSSVVAALLATAGYEVIGMTLQLYDHGAAVSRSGACCAGADIHDARRVADTLSIPHYVLDYESRFSQAVINDFADSYARGETPLPCVRCNQEVKFADLLETARQLGADCLATGHYVRRAGTPDGTGLFRAADTSRDQSYFLFATTRAQLDFLRFPLGALGKSDVRALAGRFTLPVATKPDSQDICFVPQGRYADVVRRLRPDIDAPGNVVHVDGRTLGRHPGVAHFTIGQRKGLEIGGLAEPLYVVRLDPLRREVIVGPRDALRVCDATLDGVNWLGGPVGPAGLAATARVRSTTAPVPCHVHLSGDRAVVRFPQGEFGVAPGQACVFYDGERMLGGGWIRTTSGAGSAAGAARPALAGAALP